MIKSIGGLFTTSILLLLLTACSTVSPHAVSPRLAGTAWILVELDVQQLQLPDETRAPMIAFADGKVHGSDGCNRFQGSYQEQDGHLTFGPLAATRRACLGPVADVEQGFNRALQEQTGFRVKDGHLELLAEDRVLARFSPTQNR